MGKYYCDYCDVHLTHDSASVRKAHNSGRNHLTNVREYYANLGSDQAQNMIDQIAQKYSGSGPPPMRGNFGGPPPQFGGPPRGNFGGPPPMRFGNGPAGFQQGPPPPSGGFNGPPQGMGYNQGPPQGFRPPPGMAPPPGFFGNGPPPPQQQFNQGPPPPPPQAGGEPAKLVNGLNPERARMLGLM
ncbi:hypothetical protein ACM66B_002628 [Microbotryomycetes sp. NB124-2]